MRENQTYDKALSYAVRIVNLYKYLVDEKKEYVMSKQLLRSGTSIGANISETISAESSADFVHQLLKRKLTRRFTGCSIGKDRIFIWYTTWIHVI